MKKYGSKIFTSVSFTGIAISNIKAVENFKKVHLKVNGSVLHTEDDDHIDIGEVNNFDALYGIIKGLTNLVIDGDLSGGLLNLMYDYFFVKEVKIKGNDVNQLKDDLTIDISAASDDVEITLVSKLDCIKFEYTENGKQLTTKKENELLSKIIQGKTLQDVIIDGLTVDSSSKLGNVELVDKTGKLVGKDIKLFEGDPLILTIDSTKIGNNFKTVVCKFDNDVKLVNGINLEDLYNLVLTEIVKTSLNFTEVSNKLKTVKASYGTNSEVFFSDNFGFNVIKGSNTSVTIKKSETNKNFQDAGFIVLDGIKVADINPIFLKKTFSVEFDKTGAANKNVDPDIINKIQEALNKKFQDEVNIDVKSIIDVIYGVDNGSGTKYIADNKLDDLSNISFEGVKLNGRPNVDKAKSFVDKKDIIIKLKEGAFNDGIVKNEISLTFNTDNIEKDNKKLKDDIKNAITTDVGNIKTETTKDNFVAKINSISKLKRVASKKFDKSDFDFGSSVEGNNDNITKNGTIKFNQTGIAKIDDSCFEEEPKPKPKTNDSKGSTDGGDSGEQKESTNGCCCRKKK